MSQRVHIGPLFGQAGSYVSQIGDDVQAPQRNMILDSRFEREQIHYSGFVDANARNETISGQRWVLYQATAMFPALPFVPACWYSLSFNDVCRYPIGSRDENIFPNTIGVESHTDRLLLNIYASYNGNNDAPNLRMAFLIFNRPKS